MEVTRKTYDELNKDYDDVNHRIDLNMKAQENLGKEIDKFIVAHGYQSPELDSKFQKLVDAMHVLLDERHQIAHELSKASA